MMAAPTTREPLPQSGPWRITFDTNPDDCNLRCTMCEEHSILREMRRFEVEGRRRRMDVAVIRQTVAECVGRGLREIIPSTMGEPLLYDDFDEILSVCREYGVMLNLTTNGTFPRLGATEWARRIVPLASDVKISWNGASNPVQAAIMVGSHLDRQLTNLKAFLQVRDAARAAGTTACTVTLQLTFMESNLAEIPEIVRLAIRLGVDRVKGHHLWVHLPGMRDQDLRRSPDSAVRWNLVAAECQGLAADAKLPNGARLKLTNFDPLDTSRDPRIPAGPCPFLGKEAWVNWQGRFDPCCAPDPLRQTLGAFGGVQDEGLLAIWNGGTYRTLVSHYERNPVCRTCLMRGAGEANHA